MALVKSKIDTLINFYGNPRTQPAHTGTRTIANGIWETEWDGNEEKTGRERRPEKYTPSENKSVTLYTHDDNEHVRHNTQPKGIHRRIVRWRRYIAKPDKWVRIRYTCAFCSRLFFASLFFALCVFEGIYTPKFNVFGRAISLGIMK